jgi:hypothetical protein
VTPALDEYLGTLQTPVEPLDLVAVAGPDSDEG